MMVLVRVTLQKSYFERKTPDTDKLSTRVYGLGFSGFRLIRPKPVRFPVSSTETRTKGKYNIYCYYIVLASCS